MSFYYKINSKNNIIYVLHVMQSIFSHGGTPRKLLNLIDKSNKKNIQYIFLVFANDYPNLNKQFQEAGAIVEEVHRKRSWDIRLLWDIIKIVRKHKCDIINTHFARADIFGTIAGILTRTPVIKSVHGIVWNDSRLLQRIDSVLSNYRVYTICNSEATRKAVIEETGAKNTKVIYVGVPDEVANLSPEKRAAKRKEIGIPKDAFVVGHTGGMIAIRDQSTILRAIKRCEEKGLKAYFILLGDGPLRKELEAECSRLGLSDRVRFLGYRNDVLEWISIFDVYVNMTVKEGFGIAVVEAMQAGLPVVLANAGALPELIEDGISGILVSPNDFDALSRVLINLENNSEWSSILGKQSRKRSSVKFSVQDYAINIENIYKETVCKARNA